MHVLPEKRISESLRAAPAQQNASGVRTRRSQLYTLFRFSTSRRSYERLSHHWKGGAGTRVSFAEIFDGQCTHIRNTHTNPWRHTNTMASSSVAAARSSKYTYRSSGGTSADINIEYSADLSALSRLEVKKIEGPPIIFFFCWGPTVIFLWTVQCIYPVLIFLWRLDLWWFFFSRFCTVHHLHH